MNSAAVINVEPVITAKILTRGDAAVVGAVARRRPRSNESRDLPEWAVNLNDSPRVDCGSPGLSSRRQRVFKL